MKNVFITGGLHFMATLTLLLIINVAWYVYYFIAAYNSKDTDNSKALRKLSYGKTIGLFSLTTGIMGQLMGLMSAFHAVGEAAANGIKIQPELVFGGIRVSAIVTIYGILIYLLSLVLWFVATLIIEKKTTTV